MLKSFLNVYSQFLYYVIMNQKQHVNWKQSTDHALRNTALRKLVLIYIVASVRMLTK